MKLYLYAAGAVAVLLALWGTHHDGYTAGVHATEARMAALVVKANDRTAQVEKAAREATEEASNAYQDELRRLRDARAAIPVRTVRLCPPAGRGEVPRVPGPATGADAAGAEGLPGAAGPDIGPALYGLADDGDGCAAQRDALIGWIREQRTLH